MYAYVTARVARKPDLIGRVAGGKEGRSDSPLPAFSRPSTLIRSRAATTLSTITIFRMGTADVPDLCDPNYSAWSLDPGETPEAMRPSSGRSCRPV